MCWGRSLKVIEQSSPMTKVILHNLKFAVIFMAPRYHGKQTPSTQAISKQVLEILQELWIIPQPILNHNYSTGISYFSSIYIILISDCLILAYVVYRNRPMIDGLMPELQERGRRTWLRSQKRGEGVGEWKGTFS